MTVNTNQLYKIVTDDDETLEDGLTLSQAENRLTWHLNCDADAYIQEE